MNGLLDTFKSRHLCMPEYKDAYALLSGIKALVAEIIEIGPNFVYPNIRKMSAFWADQYLSFSAKFEDDGGADQAWFPFLEKLRIDWPQYHQFCADVNREDILDDAAIRGSAEDHSERLDVSTRTMKAERFQSILLLKERLEEAQKNDERIQEVLSLQREQISLAQADSAVMASVGANFAKLVAFLMNSAKAGQSPQKPAEE